MNEPDPVDARDLRISDIDRHRVAEVLREAAGDGRIDVEELDQRLETTYDPAPLVPRPSSLPTGRAARSPAGTAPTWSASLGILGETTRKGFWDVGHTHSATAMMGSVVIDLRGAPCEGRRRHRPALSGRPGAGGRVDGKRRRTPEGTAITFAG